MQDRGVGTRFGTLTAGPERAGGLLERAPCGLRQRRYASRRDRITRRKSGVSLFHQPIAGTTHTTELTRRGGLPG